MSTNLSRLKEHYSEDTLKANLNAVDKYYFDKNIDKNIVDEKLLHLLLCIDIQQKTLLEMCANFLPDFHLEVARLDFFTNDLIKLLVNTKEAYPDDITIYDGVINIMDETEGYKYLQDGLFALSESYEADEKFLENKSLEDVFRHEMDDNDIELAYYVSTNRKPSNIKDAREFLIDEIKNDKDSKIARILASSFLQDVSLSEMIKDGEDIGIVEGVQKKGIKLFESQGTTNIIFQQGRKYKIARIKS